MKYMLLIYTAENAINEDQRNQCYKDSTELAHDLHDKGKFLGANPLQPVSTAATVRIRNGKAVITDGPFAETHEYLGGYFLVDAKDREEALGIAIRIPAAKFGTVEVRPVIEIPNLPNG